jgi:hypothetical protein
MLELDRITSGGSTMVVDAHEESVWASVVVRERFDGGLEVRVVAPDGVSVDVVRQVDEP